MHLALARIPTGMTRPLLRLGLAAGSTLATLLACELTVRAGGWAPQFSATPFGAVVTSADPELYWEPNPDHEEVNAAGLRGAPLEEPRQRPRLLLAGDSIAYGLGLEDDQTIPVHLAEHLRAAGLDVEVLNAGVAGYNCLQGARRIESLLPALEPNLVVHLFCLNDFRDVTGIPEGVLRGAIDEGAGRALELTYQVATRTPLERAVVHHSHLGRLIYTRLVKGRTSVSSRPDFDDDTGVRAGFERMRELDVPVAVVVMPFLIRNRALYPQVHESVVALAAEHDLPVLDLLDPVREHFDSGGQGLSLPGDKVHPNARGADLVASAIAEWVSGSELRGALVPRAMLGRAPGSGAAPR